MTGLRPPAAPRRPHRFVLHGEEFQDDWAWLRERDHPEVRAYLEAENAWAEAALAPTAALQQQLYAEMLGRIRQTDLSVPYRLGGWLYFTRTEEGKQYPIHCRSRGGPGDAEEVLLDLNAMAEGHAFMALGAFAVSDDGALLAYSTDTTGFREYTLRVRELATGREVAGPVPKAGTVAWCADGTTFFHTVEDEAKRQHQLWRRTLAGTAELVVQEDDERFRLSVSRTRSRRHLLLGIESHTTSEVRFLPADEPRGAWRATAGRVPDREYELAHLGDGWLIRVNDTGPNFRIVRAPEEAPGTAGWEEIVPHRDEVMVEGIDAFLGHWVAWERRDGLPGARVTDRATGAARAIAFPEPVYEAYPGATPEWEAPALRYGYESPVTPSSVYDWDFATGESRLLKRREVLGDFDPARYRCERLQVAAPDGVPVPVSVIAPRALPAGPGPMLLTGYGAYGIPYPVGFSSNRLSLLDRGVTVAIAHVRGGGELGRRWHEGGRMAQKANTFTDFIAVAEALVAAGRTAPDRLVIEGGSAGGFLVGAATNLRPALFRAVIAQVPFVDVLNTMLDPSLPLTVAEYEEWGNPAVEAEFRWLRPWCPYTNLRPGRYPAMLVRTSLHDSQVMYWEPAKYVARLRTLKEDPNPLLLVTNLGAGHGGASGRYDRLREIALDYAFLLWQSGAWAP